MFMTRYRDTASKGRSIVVHGGRHAAERLLKCRNNRETQTFVQSLLSE